MFYVYVLIDPRTNQPFYVGKGTGYRYNAHMQPNYRGTNPFKDNVIDKILTHGLEPRVRIEGTFESEDEAFQYERMLIESYGRRDKRPDGILTNLTDGGEGQRGRVTPPEVRAKIAARMIGEKNHFFGRTHSAERREKIGAAHKGKTISPEQREQIRAQQKGKVVSDETRRRMSQALLGKPKSPEHIEKMAASKRGKPLSPEHRAKLSAAQMGKPKPRKK